MLTFLLPYNGTIKKVPVHTIKAYRWSRVGAALIFNLRRKGRGEGGGGERSNLGTGYFTTTEIPVHME
jgi:hypothetical protein